MSTAQSYEANRQATPVAAGESPAMAIMRWHARRTAIAWLATTIGLIVGPWGFAALIGLPMNLAEAPHAGYGLPALLMAVAAFAMATLSPLDELIAVHRSLPVSSRGLGQVVILWPAALTAFGSWVAATVFHHQFSAPWTPVGMSLACSVSVLVCTAAYYELHRFSWGKLLLWACLLSAWGVAIASRYYPDGFRNAMKPWGIQSSEAGVALAFAIVIAWIGIRAVVQVRSQNFRSSRLLHWLRLPPHELFSELAAGASRDGAAPTWLKGDLASLPYLTGAKDRSVMLTTLAIAAPFVVPLSVLITRSDASEDLRVTAFAILSLFAGAFGTLFGVSLARTDFLEHQFVPSLFSLPVTTRRLANTISNSLLKRGLVLQLLMLGLAVGAAWCAGIAERWEAFQQQREFLDNVPPAAVGLGCTLMNCVALGLAMSGWCYVLFAMGRELSLFIAAILFSVVAGLGFAGQSADGVFWPVTATIFAAIALKAAATWLYALRLRLVAAGELAFAALLICAGIALNATASPFGNFGKVAWSIVWVLACSAKPAIVVLIHRRRHA